MADLRTHQTVAQRLDLEFNRRPSRLLRARRWVTLACGVAALLLIAAFTASGDRTVYWSRPLSDAHRLWQHDCGQCHRRHWQPVWRLIAADNDASPSVRDDDCRQCHAQHRSDHNPLVRLDDVRDCVACHREHRGQRVLSAVADRFCVECHVDLKTRGDVHTVETRIPSMHEHPELARLRSQRPDESVLSFSHHGHLQPLLPAWQEAAAAGSGQPPPAEQLVCGDCHQPTDDGAYMRPIVYEQHCARCHPLRFSGKTDSDAPLPHEEVEVVYGALRQRLMNYAREHPQEVLQGRAAAPSRLPQKATARQPTAQDRWEWVENELQLLEGDVFHNALKNGCRKCHPAPPHAAPGGETAGPFAILPPNLPSRWLEMANFRHDRHRELACVVCHNTLDPQDYGPHTPAEKITLDSRQVADVLLPSIQVCKQCHGKRPGQSGPAQARGDCLECHQYHHVQSPGKDLLLEDLLTSAAEEPATR